MLGTPKKTWRKPLALGDVLEARAGIGDGDEVAARLLSPTASFTRSKRYC